MAATLFYFRTLERVRLVSVQMLVVSILILSSQSALTATIYSADFSTAGQGFTHSDSSPPASAPQFVNGGSATSPEGRWTALYQAAPLSDSTTNEFMTASGKMRIQDWGGTARWQSFAIDVSAVDSVTITAVGVTIGNEVQNAGSEFFRYFYQLDGDADQITSVLLSGDTAGTVVNYSLTDLAVSTANTLIVGFEFKVNGVDDGYEISSFQVTSNAATATDPEPTNHPTSFTATANSVSQIITTWTDATGMQLPASYLVMCAVNNNFTDPVDGVAQSDDTNCADGNGVQNIAQGTQTVTWTGLSANTPYFFKTFPYTNSGASIDYKTSDSPLTANTTTSAPVATTCTKNAPVNTCIHEIQGDGASSTMVDNIVTVEGIVTGDFQDGTSGTQGDMNGFFVQEEDNDADNNMLTSEGIFIFDGSAPAVNVAVGDKVQVTGKVTEFQALTELTNITTVTIVSNGNSLPTAATVNLPFTSGTEMERFEGMFVTFPQELTVNNTYNLSHFGEIELSFGGRLDQPTNIVAPGTAASARQVANNLNRILLDDGRTTQNPEPTPYNLSAINTIRGGDTITGLTGVINFSSSRYRVLKDSSMVTFTRTNPRPDVPSDVGGMLKVASFNVLNYFTTLDGNGDICGSLTDHACRGADNATEFNRQRDKIIAAIKLIDADIIGLMEVENTTATSGLQDLVDGLNAATGPGAYSFVNTGTIGTDAIRVGLIYKPAAVNPVGSHAILDSSVDANFIDTKNRPSLAQTFEQMPTGGKFTVVVNHFKSKGSDCNSLSDPDANDGQGNCNLTRTKAATALKSWLATDPTGSGDPDFLVMGDFNAYAKEDPITTLEAAGYVNQATGYSYSFDGQWGTLDHMLANSTLNSQVTGATKWHINADEPVALDYNTEFKSVAGQASLYSPDQFRSSDHDPIIIGLNLTSVVIPSPSPSPSSPPAYNLAVTITGNGTISSSDGKIICGTNCDEKYPILTTVTLEAVAAAGFDFTGWTGACSGTDVVFTLTVDQALSCGATFTAQVTSIPNPNPNPTPITNTAPIISIPVADINLEASSQAPLQLSLFSNFADAEDADNALHYTIIANSNPSVVTATLIDPASGQMMLQPGDVVGSSLIIIKVTDTGGLSVTDEFSVSLNAAPPVHKIPEIPALPVCPANKEHNSVCNARNQVVNFTHLLKGGVVSSFILKTLLHNDGQLANFVIEPDGKVIGGQISGYVDNNGEMENIEFIGAEIKGGRLLGLIRNTSQVGGIIRDVVLGENTQIIGGRLGGRITGHFAGNTRIENVVLKRGTVLINVEIGPNVHMESDVSIETIFRLPFLGRVFGTRPDGKSFNYATGCAGGASRNGGLYFSKLRMLLRELFDVRGRFEVDARHVGQKADLVMYAEYSDLAGNPIGIYTLNKDRSVQTWDTHPATLPALRSNIELSAVQQMHVYSGLLSAVGQLRIHFGYRLSDGTVVFNEQPIEVTIE